MIVVRNPFKEHADYGKYCAVKESRNRGWWLPAGAVDAGEEPHIAALRECKEEAGIDIDLKGVLRVDYGVGG